MAEKSEQEGPLKQKSEAKEAASASAVAVVTDVRSPGWTLREIVSISLQSAKKELAVALGAVVVSSGTNLAMPKLIGWMVDLVAGRENRAKSEVSKGAAISLAVFALGAVASVTRVYFLEISATKIATRLREDLFHGLMNSRNAAVNADKAAAVTALSKDCEDLAKSICKNLASVYRGCNSAFGGTTMLLFISPHLTMVSLSFLPVVGVGAMGFAKLSRRQAKFFKEETELAICRAGDRVENLRTVKLFHNEEFEEKNFSADLKKLLRPARKAAIAEGLFMGGLGMALNASMLAVVMYGGSLVRTGAISAGQLASFGLYSGLVGLGFSQLSASHAEIKKSLSANQRVKTMLSAPPSESSRADLEVRSEVVLPTRSGRVKFSSVSFGYTEDRNVLTDLSMELEPGKVIALAGVSGEGKSTIVNLLCRMIEPTPTGITWDGIDIRTIPTTLFRRILSVVDQSPALFKGLSISENIRYSKGDASFEEIQNASILAGADEFIRSLPQGYETRLGSAEQAQLSVGQVQRIALARAFLRRDQVQLLCFDESTSALDLQSEQRILAALRQLAKEGKIVLVVAHRTTTLQKADEIFVLQNGKIVDRGSYEILVQRGGGPFTRVLSNENK